VNMMPGDVSWEMGFYAGFIVDSNNMAVIAKQLHHLMTHGLLDGSPKRGQPLTIISPPLPTVARRRRSRSNVAGTELGDADA